MIELVLAWDAVFNAVSAAAMLAFGVWVLTLTPRTRPMTMLAVFAIATGMWLLPENLTRWTGWERYAIWEPYRAVVWTVGGLAFLGLAHSILQPRDDRTRRLWHLAVGVAVLLPLAFVATLPAVPWASVASELETWQLLSALVANVANLFYYTAFLGLGLVLARRYIHPPGDRAEPARTQAVLVSAALVMWPAMAAGWFLENLADPSFSLLPWQVKWGGLFGGFLLLAGLWLVNARGVPDRSAEGRNIALLTLAMLLLGLVQGVFIDSHFGASDGPVWGVVRLGTLLVLGYAILRHEVLGIEAKFRFGISKTTVAGVFVTVFFIVSEGAQVLFAGVVGSQLLGIIAAGALLFALSPIQKMADRIAEEVVPGGETGRTDAEEIYRRQIEMALADGEITAAEERLLAERAEDLGISHTRELEIREAVGSAAEGEDGKEGGP